jgi:hypothetical protein
MVRQGWDKQSMDKQKIAARLATYSWEELNWLEDTVRALKENARGPRTYRVSDRSSASSQRESRRAFEDYFDDVAAKHGIY